MRTTRRLFFVAGWMTMGTLAGCATAADTDPRGSTPADAATLLPIADEAYVNPVLSVRDAVAAVSDANRDGPVDPGNQTLHRGNVPDGVEALFRAAMTAEAGPGPTLVYPAPDTMFPPDLARILFQWTAPTGSLFRLRFATNARTLDVYTDGVDATCQAASPQGRCWESGPDTLQPYFQYAAGEDVTLELRAVDPSAPTVALAPRQFTFHVAREPALGAIYYWSTTAKGIRRGTLDGRAAADYLTPTTGLSKSEAAKLTTDQQAQRCVACHTMSRSGKRMSVALFGDILGVVGIGPDAPPPFTYASSGAYGSDPILGASWTTFSPDENKIVTASQGFLTVRDISVPNRAPSVGGQALTLPSDDAGAPYYGSMPDWSPDGQHLVFTATPGDSKARHLSGSSIAWMTTDGDGFSGFELLAQSRGVVRNDCTHGGRESYANPMWSPDGRYLATSRGDCESEGDATSEILLLPAQKGATANHLVRANSQVGEGQASNLQNGMPTWGPKSQGDIAWIAFTSAREYGVVLVPGTPILATIGWPVRQLWIAAVDLSKMGGTEDPSYPAFRLPSQDFTENNHRPFWTIDVLPNDWTPPPPPPDPPPK